MNTRIIAALTELRDALTTHGVNGGATIYAHASGWGDGAAGSGVCCHGDHLPHAFLTEYRAAVDGLDLCVIHERPATEAEIVAHDRHQRDCRYHWSRRPEIANAPARVDGEVG